ncbi:MAG: DUF2167 domain-containing protein [Xanthomonadales bacterium]|jgi:hypothetical protein|nr:DUF2167 domain-containing protein [Xanthomonadales bacterium]MBK7143732.1 DUF2167 domain-containing protein [Xanthomonadales bacterium]MCC6560761.1 DUF2167 domain-containing protein [Xanthomonadales bacterium]
MLMIATVLLLVLAGWAGIIAAKLSLWRGLMVALLPLVGIAVASVTGYGLVAYAALLPLGYLAYRHRGTEYDILLPLVGLLIAAWLWNSSSSRSKAAASQAYEAQVAAFREQSETAAADAAETTARWPQRAAKLKRQRGKLALADTGAELQVPEHWRFIEAAPLRASLSGTRHFPGLGVIGWLVHERVDLAQLDTIWYVEVYAEQRGHVKASGVDASDLERRKGDATSKLSARALAAGGVSFLFKRFVEPPNYDAQFDRAVWVDEMSYGGETSLLLDCYAIKLGKEAQVWYRMREQFVGSRELCLRSVRLMAAKTQFAADSTYADYTWLVDDSSGYDLGEVIADEHRVDD